jgi:hypothetical protein
MAEHVSVHTTIRKFLITKSFHHPGKADRGPWPASFGEEDVTNTWSLIALDRPQSP